MFFVFSAILEDVVCDCVCKNNKQQQTQSSVRMKRSFGEENEC
jgi:hypothetical protein